MLKPKGFLTNAEAKLKKLEQEIAKKPCPFCSQIHKANEDCSHALGRTAGIDKVKAKAAKRDKYTCRRGHDLSDPSSYYLRQKKDRSIWLECKACKKLRDKGRGTRPKGSGVRKNRTVKRR